MKTREERAEALRPHVQTVVDRLPWRTAAKHIGVSVGALRNLLDGSTPQEDTLVRLERWADEAGVRLNGGREEETPEDAVAQTEVEREVENVLRVVRLVDGKEDFTPEQRQGLKRDILITYIGAFREDGFDTKELEAMLGRVTLGEL